MPVTPRQTPSPLRFLGPVALAAALAWPGSAPGETAPVALGGPPAQTATEPAATERAAAEPVVFALDDVRSGTLMLRTDSPGAYVAAPLVSTRIAVSVTGPILRATVSQRFRNPAGAWVEGVYAFPLPEESAVDGLRLRIGDRFVEGRIEEREKARETYEAAKAEGTKAALVEEERPNLFTTSVANIGPGEVVVVQIAFQQTLAPKDGRWELRMPLVAAPRYNPAPAVRTVDFGADGWAVDPVADPVPDRGRIESPVIDPRGSVGLTNPVSLEVDLAPGWPLAGLESPSHDIAVTGEGEARRVALAGPVSADRDFVLRWRPAGGEASASLFGETQGGSRHLLLTLAPPEIPETAVGPREVIFVQDVSGSMAGQSIEQARLGLAAAIRRLRPQDSFNLIVFNDRFARLFETPRAAMGEAVETAIAAVGGLEADGGTEMYPALEAALSTRGSDPARLRQVIFLTDGAVGNEAEMLALIDRALGRSRLFTVGIGSAPNSHFMVRAAEMGRGAHVYIGDPDEVQAAMDALFAKIERPAITDLALDLPADVDGEVYPAPLPDLYAGSPLAIALRVGEARGLARLSGRLAGEPWAVDIPLGGAADRPGVARLWARRKIASIEALRLRTATGPSEAEALDAMLLATALEAGLVSRLTALVAVDTTASRPAGAETVTRDVPLALPAGWDPDVFLGEAPPAPAPAPTGAVARIAASAAPQGALAIAAGAPVPDTALGWAGVLRLAALMMLAGALLMLARLGRHPARHRRRARA